MDITHILAIVLIVLVIILVIYLICIVDPKLPTMIDRLEADEKSLPLFTTDVQFDPYPSTVNIENEIDCNVTSLRVCDINDSTTLYGCKELIVRCQHFDHDTPYINNGITTIVPKNKTPTEGYALAITVIAESCNVYHGDLTLVAIDDMSKEYMMICTCKNPGYIGNETILGNCTTPYICNGKVDSIDKPLSQINCKCLESEKGIRYESDGLPSCRELTIQEANGLFKDFSHLIKFNSDRQLSILNFNHTISDNVHSSKLLDPCRNSLNDTTIEINNAYYDSIHGECHFRNEGYPVTNGMLDFHPPGLGKEKSSDCGIATGIYHKIRFMDNVGGKRHIYAIIIDGLKVGEEFNNSIITVLPEPGISYNNNSALFINPIKNQFYTPRCVGHWPRYRCAMANTYSYSSYGIPISVGRKSPGTFWWGYEQWDNAETMIQLTVDARGPNLLNVPMIKVTTMKPMGIQWINDDYQYQRNGIVEFTNQHDYDLHKNIISK